MSGDVTNSACSPTCLQPRGHGGACDVDYESLGRRAVACKGFRWMAGMLTLPFVDEFKEEVHPAWRICREDQPTPFVQERCNAFPDIRDPATLGCLVALVSEVCVPGTLARVFERSAFWPWVNPSLIEALIAALESAPQRSAT